MRVAPWLLAALLLPPVAAAQDGAGWQLELGHGVERYEDDAAATWLQTDLALRSRFAPRAVAELNARRTRRYGRDDQELGLGLAMPLDARWSITASASASPTHRVLAKSSGALGLARSFDGGWVVGAGLARSRYDSDGGSSGNTTLRLNGERYVGAWRFALGANRSRLDGGETEHGWVAGVDRYLGERGRVGLIVARGRELENLPPNGIVSTRVETVALVGVWPLARDWALTGALGSTRNRDGVRRTGPDAGEPVGVSTRRLAARLGVQHDF